MWFRLPEPLVRQLVPKGSVAVDGVSLTVVEIANNCFSVALIPHTLEMTTLGRSQVRGRGQYRDGHSGKIRSAVAEDMKQAARQTRTHIGELLARHGVNPRHDLGQNFLIDLNLVEFLVAQAELGSDDLVLEVGSGTGGLTAFLAERAGRGDRCRSRSADAAVDGRGRRRILQRDDPGLRRAQKQESFCQARARRARCGDGRSSKRLKLVANLPYCVATPVISNLVASDYAWERMVVTIQLELAERMTAKAGDSSYGALSVWLPSQCHIELLKRLPADVFWPRPKVESAMIRITPDAERRERIRDRAFLHEFLAGRVSAAAKAAAERARLQLQKRTRPDARSTPSWNHSISASGRVPKSSRRRSSSISRTRFLRRFNKPAARSAEPA